MMTIAADRASADHRRLGFWIGDRDTFEIDTPDGASIARARIRPVAKGCAIQKIYEHDDGLIRDSILSFDPVRRYRQKLGSRIADQSWC